ncbi:hypothetical protein CAPTEDRAFT_191234 [Capitella teleta]|uniref:Uncharacterized protein n=1 Tax=Capitella teleta TaxID=283909 RepID=R7TLD9_CAPTE|nr:hypothetical protein CAPTEDRAFT_191234 [Capitella teleta]|eukprot:ELT92356.1 hypothetical protein CAPTEDRAFT_191234 [Capitella teleta]
MRGGSTFLGELFNQHPDAFYWFEPLHNYQLTRRPPHISPDFYLFSQGSESSTLTSEELQAHLDIVTKIFSCDLESLPMYIFADDFFTSWEVPKKMMKYRTCMDGTPTKQTSASGAALGKLHNFNRIYNLTPRDLRTNDSAIQRKIESTKDVDFEKPEKVNFVFPFKVRSCLHLLEEPCRTSKVIAIKSIRFAAEFIPHLGNAIDKVIHLSRDPRGIMNSRSDRDPIKRVKEILCDHMLADINSRRKQAIQNPNLFFPLKYEDMASKPLQFAKSVYNFIQLPTSNETLGKFVALTHQKKDNGPVGTSRKNSSATASAWVSQMVPWKKKLVTEACAETILQYGYT